jgi:hypothetical protein
MLPIKHGSWDQDNLIEKKLKKIIKLNS